MANAKRGKSSWGKVKVARSTMSEGHWERQKIQVIEIEEFEELSIYINILTETVAAECECTCHPPVPFTTHEGPHF